MDVFLSSYYELVYFYNNKIINLGFLKKNFIIMNISFVVFDIIWVLVFFCLYDFK